MADDRISRYSPPIPPRLYKPAEAPSVQRGNPQAPVAGEEQDDRGAQIRAATGLDGTSTFQGASPSLSLGGPLAGAIGGQNWGAIRPGQKNTVDTQNFYRDVAKAEAEYAKSIEPQVRDLETQRAQAKADAAQAKSDMEKQGARPSKGDPNRQSWESKRDELKAKLNQANERARTARDDIEKLKTGQPLTEGGKPVRLRAGGVEFSPGSSPVAANVTDMVTGKSFNGLNSPTNSLPDNLHPVLKGRLGSDRFDLSQAHGSVPGTHAEIHALNDALWAREEWNGGPRKGSPGADAKVTVTEADLKTFSADTAWLKGSKDGTIKAGDRAPMCLNCDQLTKGVQNRAGVSGKEPQAPSAIKAPTDTAPNPSAPKVGDTNLDAAKGGAKAGFAAGLGLSTLEAIQSGHLDGKKFGKDVLVSTAAGSVAGVVEENAAKFIDRKAGQLVQDGVEAVAKRGVAAETAGIASTSARAIASRVGGAGIAGGVVNAGFAAVDQVGAYRRGEVTGSQAIGNVAGEAAVGVGAGMAGAAIGATVGSVVPGVGTVVGAAVGFGVGYLADKGLRGLGVDKAVAGAVTSTADGLQSAYRWAFDS